MVKRAIPFSSFRTDKICAPQTTNSMKMSARHRWLENLTWMCLTRLPQLVRNAFLFWIRQNLSVRLLFFPLFFLLSVHSIATAKWTSMYEPFDGHVWTNRKNLITGTFCLFGKCSSAGVLVAITGQKRYGFYPHHLLFL